LVFTSLEEDCILGEEIGKVVSEEGAVVEERSSLFGGEVAVCVV